MKLINIIRTLAGAVPAFESDKKAFSRFKIGEMYPAKILEPRNIKFHRKFFALLNLAFENQERIEKFNNFRSDVTIQAGFYETYINLNGEEVKVARSISFAKMKNPEFEDLYNACFRVILNKVLIGSTINEIEEELLKFL